MRMRSHYIVLLLLLFWTNSFSAITLHNLTNSKKYPIEAIKSNGTEYVALAPLCEAMGYTHRQNVYSRAFYCSRGNRSQSLTFIESNHFVVTAESTVIQMSMSPAILHGKLAIPVFAIPEIFSTEEHTINWRADEEIITVQRRAITANAVVPSSRKGIKSVDCSVKQNGTLLTIELSDSIPFDYMYYHPNLILNFFGGVVDTSRIKVNEKTGIIKSVSSVQFKESAQISIILTTMIEDPLIDYVQDTKTVLVALRPMKPGSATVNKPKVQGLSEKRGIIIVLDPGHGGKDPGAIGFGDIKEKDVVLRIALDLRDMLKNKPDVTIVLTREKDVFIPLSERTQFANEKKADLFLSIHADAVPGNAKRKNSIRGYKIYFLSQAKNDEDKMVAMRENAVIELEDKPQNYSNLQNVLIDLAGNEFLRESQDLCILVDQRFTSLLKKKIEKLHLGVGQANFWVLNGAFMPSVLVETGFLSNPDEAKLLSDRDFQKSLASALCDAILNFSKRYGTGL